MALESLLCQQVCESELPLVIPGLGEIIVPGRVEFIEMPVVSQQVDGLDVLDQVVHREEEHEEETESLEHGEDGKKKKKTKEKMSSLRRADYPPSGKKPKLDPSGTLEAASDLLEKLLDSGSHDKMSTET